MTHMYAALVSLIRAIFQDLKGLLLKVHLHNYFDIHVCPSLRRPSSASLSSVCPVPSRPTSNIHHIQGSRSPVRPLLGEAKPSCVYLILKPHGQSSRQKPDAKSGCSRRGEVEVRILNFKNHMVRVSSPPQS